MPGTSAGNWYKMTGIKLSMFDVMSGECGGREETGVRCGQVREGGYTPAKLSLYLVRT